MSAEFRQRIAADTARLKAAGRLRLLEQRTDAQTPTVTINGRSYRNFTSNDYLGLAAHPAVISAVHDTLGNHGFGAGGAALLSGRSALHAELENKIAAYLGTESALLFSSGYLANTGALPALITRDDLVHHDRLNHASLIDGVLNSKAKHHRYPHLALPKLTTDGDQQQFVITESLFSMDGDIAPLARLGEHCAEHNAVLYIDDAHGFGVTNNGRGAAAVSLAPSITTIYMVTLGKALGSHGAVIAAPRFVIDSLVQHARTFIFDTAPPAVSAAAALAALELLKTNKTLQTRLQTNIQHFRTASGEAGIPLLGGDTPIQPIMIGQDQAALDIAATLHQRGIYVRAVRPPTVPQGTARLRVTITAAHNRSDIDALVNALAEALAE